MKIILKNIDYTYRYGDTAISNLSLNVDNNENVAILGFEKSGKTTLLKIIARLLVQSKGEVIINNKNYNDKTAKIENMQMVFSHGGFFKHKTFKGNISYGLSKQKFEKDKIKELLYHPFNSLCISSYPTLGFSFDNEEIVRLNMERIFHRKADILLIDNIFNLLNVENRFEIFLQYLDLFQNNLQTLIFATNSIDEAFMISNKVYYIEQGQIIDIITNEDCDKFTNSFKLLKSLNPFINEILLNYEDKNIIAAFNLSLENKNINCVELCEITNIQDFENKNNLFFCKNKKIVKTDYGFLKIEDINQIKKHSKIYVSNVAFYDYYSGLRINDTSELLNKFYDKMQIKS